MSKLKEKQEQCLSLSKRAFEDVKSQLPEIDRHQIYEFIYLHNEWGLGIETIIDVVKEKNLKLNDLQVQAIKNACHAMNLRFE